MNNLELNNEKKEEKTGSTYKVPLTEILEVKKHPYADRLDIVTVYGFEVITKKDQYKVGDRILYIPIDSILPQKLEDHLFPPDSKIKLHNHRVKQIRIRKIASQGMLIDIHDIRAVYGIEAKELERDYAEDLDITKYEPPAPKFSMGGGAQNNKRDKPLENHNFHKYNGLDNIKWYPTLFKEGERVAIQEKIHGTNSRASIMPYETNTLWKKIKNFFGFVPKFEYCFGSNNVQLQERPTYAGFYEENIYEKVFKQIDAEKKLKPGEAIYGEIYGDGIQKNYSYGCKSGEHKFVLFDVKILQSDGTQKWLNPDDVMRFAEERGFDMVPTVYIGPFSIDKAKQLTIGNSALAPSQKVREGVVVKAMDGYCDKKGNKKALKIISEKYLDKEQTDFH